MANMARGELTVELDRPRIWNLTWRQISEIEGVLSQRNKRRTTWQEFCRGYGKWGIDDYALVLWAGLHAEDPSLELGRVMDLATQATYQRFVLEFTELLEASIPDRLKKKYEAEAKKVVEEALKEATEETKAAAETGT